MSETEKRVFQYVQIKSLVHPDFWHKLSDIKLDFEKLEEKEREIIGTYSNLNAKSCLIEYDCTAFNSSFSTSTNNLFCRGILKNLNTIESFKNCDKAELLRKEGENLLRNIENGSVLEDPSKLVSFILLTYAVIHKESQPPTTFNLCIRFF
jgi:ubiquitin-like modifier-activating enzyme ATG7